MKNKSSDNLGKLDSPTNKARLISLGWASWVIASFFLASLATASMILILQYYQLLDMDNPGTAMTFAIDIAVYVAMFVIMLWLPSLIWLKKRKNKHPESESLARLILSSVGLNRWPKWVDVQYFFANLPVFYIVMITISVIGTLILGNEIMNQSQEVGFMPSDSVAELTMIFISLVIVAPFFEEMIMRGFLFGKLRKNFGLWTSAIIVSVLFGLAHGQINAGIMTFILSMFSCRMREKTGAIWASIFLHMAVNMLAFSIRFLGFGS